MKHVWRYSDSSFYDAVCTACNCTDAVSDIRAKLPCMGDEHLGIIQAQEMDVQSKKHAFEQAVAKLEKLREGAQPDN